MKKNHNETALFNCCVHLNTCIPTPTHANAESKQMKTMGNFAWIYLSNSCIKHTHNWLLLYFSPTQYMLNTWHNAPPPFLFNKLIGNIIIIYHIILFSCTIFHVRCDNDNDKYLDDYVQSTQHNYFVLFSPQVMYPSGQMSYWSRSPCTHTHIAHTCNVDKICKKCASLYNSVG